MKKYTRLSLLIILTTWLSSFFFYQPWHPSNAMSGGDCTGYYMYLPAVFLQHDLKDLKQTIYERDKAAGITRDTAKDVSDVDEVYFINQTPVIKYTCGIAILESPAFLTAHIIAILFKQPDTGFSKTFIFLVQIWNLIFAFAGLYLLAGILREFFPEDDIVIALTLFTIAVGTNLYHFVVYNTGMSHPYLFSLYVVLLFATIGFYKKYMFKFAALIGISAGLITLARPNEVICLLIPALYGVPHMTGLKERITTLLKNKGFYLAVATFSLCALPQLLYWKGLTGHWLYYSYGKESFNFKHSQIFHGLFGFKNGWLPYTPVMIFALLGLLPMFLNKGKTLLATIIFLPLHIYIIYSWWCWNYINGLGSRPMIEAYALLSIPLATFTYYACKNKIAGFLWAVVIIFFAAQQMMMTWQSSRNILWSEDSNRSFYVASFFKTHINMNDVIVYDTNEKQPENARFDHLIFSNNFEDSINPGFVRNTCGTGQFSFMLDNKIAHTPPFERSLSDCGVGPLDWIKISFDNCNPPPCGSLYDHASLCVAFKNTNTYKAATIRIQNKMQPKENCGIWIFPCYVSGKVSFFTQVPKDAKPGDKLKVYGFNCSSSPVIIDNLKIEAYSKE